MNNSDFEKKINNYGKELIEEKGYICSVDMLLKLRYLTKKDYDDWRFGKVAYLEKICSINLKKLSTLNKTIAKISKQWNLKESWTAYNRYGKGKKTRLKFCKSGNEKIEKAYATHYISKKVEKKCTNV
jgi:hypothetical protein